MKKREEYGIRERVDLMNKYRERAEIVRRKLKTVFLKCWANANVNLKLKGKVILFLLKNRCREEKV